MSRTPSRQLEPASLSDVEIDDAFWNPRLEINRTKTLENQLEKLDSRIENLERVAGWTDGGFEGPYHNDPPIYKWIEAASYVLATDDDPDLKAEVDEVVDVIKAAQDDDGYIHAYFQLEQEPEERFTNLAYKHELFAVGHLVEAAIAHRRATGEDRLFAVAKRAADHVCEVFGPNGNPGYPGHEETELAFVALYRETGEQRYLDTAKFFVDMRGQDASRFRWEHDNPEYIVDTVGGLYEDDDGNYQGEYAQDHAPVREQDTAEGHAVKATFLYCGMADVAAETGDEELMAALETLWENVTEKRMYVTGGIGASGHGEAFGDDYELPNDAYAETCAAFGNIIWNQRMLELTGEGRFGDVIERTLYNGLLAGVSLDGTQFCYTNPLTDTDEDRHRQPWYHTSCCPPNVARFLASLQRYIYAADGDDLYVNLYIGNEAALTVGDQAVDLDLETEYPWDGTVDLDVEAAEPTEFALHLRDPWWADDGDVDVTVDGETVDPDREDGFLVLEREWNDAAVTVSFDMTVDRVAAHPEVEENYGEVALQRGPLVYCLEAVDNEHPVFDLRLDEEFDPETRHVEDFIDGEDVTVVEADGVAPDREDWADALYQPVDAVEDVETTITAVPYYAWDNRDAGEMSIWVQDA